MAEHLGRVKYEKTVRHISERIMEQMREWSSQPLDVVHAAVFIDAIVVKVRDGRVANRAFYAATGVGLDGTRDVLGNLGVSRQ